MKYLQRKHKSGTYKDKNKERCSIMEWEKKVGSECEEKIVIFCAKSK